MDTNEPTTIFISTQPTAKEQLVQIGIGLGASLAVTALTLGALAAVGYAMEKHQDRKAKKHPAIEK